MGLFGKNSATQSAQAVLPTPIPPLGNGKSETVRLQDWNNATVRLQQTPAYQDGRDPVFEVVRQITFAESTNVIL